MSILQKLPVGIQSFETIRKNNYVYVDKTRYIHRMIHDGLFYFLSRPRRFGKSLLVSTLKCLFTAKRSLFSNLWISQHAEWDWKEYPIILFDFNGIAHDSPQHLETGLTETLGNIAQKNSVELKSGLLQGKLKELILGLHQKKQQHIVVLVDERPET